MAKCSGAGKPAPERARQAVWRGNGFGWGTGWLSLCRQALFHSMRREIHEGAHFQGQRALTVIDKADRHNGWFKSLQNILQMTSPCAASTFSNLAENPKAYLAGLKAGHLSATGNPVK